MKNGRVFFSTAAHKKWFVKKLYQNSKSLCIALAHAQQPLGVRASTGTPSSSLNPEEIVEKRTDEVVVKITAEF